MSLNQKYELNYSEQTEQNVYVLNFADRVPSTMTKQNNTITSTPGFCCHGFLQTPGIYYKCNKHTPLNIFFVSIVYLIYVQKF